MTHDHEVERVLCARHEAAHAMAAGVFGFTLLGCGIWPSDDRPWEGGTSFDTGCLDEAKATHNVEHELVIGWAGRAVEEALGAQLPHPLMDPDVHIIRDIAARIHPAGTSAVAVDFYAVGYFPAARAFVHRQFDAICALGDIILGAPAAVVEGEEVAHGLDGPTLAGHLTAILGYPIRG